MKENVYDYIASIIIFCVTQITVGSVTVYNLKILLCVHMCLLDVKTKGR